MVKPKVPEYFDYMPVARAAGITSAELRAIEDLFAADYPSDLMLRELHVLRACNAVKAGRTNVAEILAPPGRSAA